MRADCSVDFTIFAVCRNTPASIDWFALNGPLRAQPYYQEVKGGG